MKNREKNGFSTLGIIIIIAAGLLIGGGFFAYQYQKIPKVKEYIPAASEQSAPTKSPQPSPDTIDTIDTSTWKTYRNEEYGFEVKYPKNWASQEITGLTHGEREIFNIGFGEKRNDIALGVLIVSLDDLDIIPILDQETFRVEQKNDIIVAGIPSKKYTAINIFTQDVCAAVISNQYDRTYAITSCPVEQEFDSFLSTFKFIK